MASQERWKELERLLDQALDVAPEGRLAFLDRACAGDPALRAEAERLLLAAEATGSFLKEPGPAYAAPLVDRLAEAEALTPGTRLGAYEIVRQLGRGGMATVYLAQDHKHRRSVAIKVLHPELARTVGPERFLREIELVARLQHPHILPLIDSGQADGALYYVMPYVEGESLRARLNREGELPVPDAVGILREMVDALAYAHAHGVIHRDIKPDNVLLTSRHAVVADFGIAKALSAAAVGSGGAPAATMTGLALGTPAYMAPEQAAGNPHVDHRADLYAAGATAYEMLAGQPPFTGSTAQALLGAHLSQPPAPLRHHRGSVSSALEAIVMRCLEKRPADRWQSAAELLHAPEGVATPAGGTPTGTAVDPATLKPARRVPARRRLLVALALLLVLLAGLAALLRERGVFGPRSLVAQGLLAEREPILLADFQNRSRDSLLGPAITEALRVDLSQSTTVALVPTTQVRDGLRRMQRPAENALAPDLAHELAIREGIKAVIAGDIARLGSGYILSARIVAPASGAELAAFRETADDSTALIAALGRLSRELRARVGESLRSIQSSPPLERVTTSSLEALRYYSRAFRISNEATTDAQRGQALALLEQAVALDSGFAMGYRKLGIILSSQGEQSDRALEAFKLAMQHRDRLTDAERYITKGTYYTEVDRDLEKAVAAYQALLERDPSNVIALFNLSFAYSELRQYGKGVELARAAVVADHYSPVAYVDLMGMQVAAGDVVGARQTLDTLRGRHPNHPQTEAATFNLIAAEGRYAEAESLARAYRARARGDPGLEIEAKERLRALAVVRGRLAEAERLSADIAQAAGAQGNIARALTQVTYMAYVDARVRDDPPRAARRLDAALIKYPLTRVPPSDNAYRWVAWNYAVAGRPGRARELLSNIRAKRDPALHYYEGSDHSTLAEAALAEGRFDRAIAEFQAADQGGCAICGLPHRAHAFLLAGQVDSARALYGGFVESVGALWVRWWWLDPAYRAESYLALARLWETDDRQKALEYYGKFVDLWENADPELQPRVTEARRRIAALAVEAGGGR